MTEPEESQLASAVLMIRPVRFASNPLTAASNRFQGRNPDEPAQQQRDAEREFDGLREALTTAGIDVVVVPDTLEPEKPDAVFPNNWVSFHADGTVVMYAMLAPNRRTERRPDIIETLVRDHGFLVRDVVDLSCHEADGNFLEGTGSLVLDRVHRVAYACLSPRTSQAALGDFAKRLKYDVVAFDAVDRGGTPVYHTNVLMNVGEKIAVICAGAIPDDDQRTAVLARLCSTGHEVIEITMEQVNAFAGNMLELRAASGKRVIAMSEQARNSLNNDQHAALERAATIVSAPIEHIERSAGGSVRCMLAEIHLPREAPASAATTT
jgi:hypothetical protein